MHCKRRGGGNVDLENSVTYQNFGQQREAFERANYH